MPRINTDPLSPLAGPITQVPATALNTMAKGTEKLKSQPAVCKRDSITTQHNTRAM